VVVAVAAAVAGKAFVRNQDVIAKTEPSDYKQKLTKLELFLFQDPAVLRIAGFFLGGSR
jgi:hypothetical protein